MAFWLFANACDAHDGLTMASQGWVMGIGRRPVKHRQLPDREIVLITILVLVVAASIATFW